MRTPSFAYYLTTRGLNAEGGIFTLDYLPESFHQYVTVVASKEHRKEIRSKYPALGGYWCCDDPKVNSAASKRHWIMVNSPVDNFFYLNAETRFYTDVGGGKARVARTEEKAFLRNVLALEDLAGYYVGVAANQKPFSQGLLKSASKLHDNYVLGAWFHWNRKFALKHIEFNRVSYLDDCDYVLQSLYKGYRVCNFAGILYEHRTHVPQRNNIDRTLEVQEKDTVRLLKMHPDVISRKPDYDPLTQNVGVNIKFSRAYKPRGTITVVHSAKEEHLAVAAFLSCLKKKKNFRVHFVSLEISTKEKATIRIIDPTLRKVLRVCGLPTHGMDVRPATAAILNQSDMVFFVNSSDMKTAKSSFPRVDPSKFVPLPGIKETKLLPGMEERIKSVRDNLTGFLERSK